MVAILAAVVAALAATAPGSATAAPAWCADHASIAVLGDSGSTGYGLPGYPGGDVYAPTADGWASRITTLAATTWRTTTTVLAHNGAMVSDFLPGGRWPETTAAVGRVGQLQPSLVLVELGANEYIQDRSPTAVLAPAYHRLVDSIKAASPRSTIAVVAQWQAGHRNSAQPRNTSWAAYAEVIAQTAADEGSRFLDLRQYLPPGDSAAGQGLFLADHVHPTAAGHHVVADAVWTLLRDDC
ncbi:acyl-CoA thioesterase-1 [Amycolatopsis bartoniae]|uniref:SGNH hydrolase-type esterase domain-containing protein n=1 Tax=Amycolatopsis bartoniae TaxID=941986 RepID=A0A8H9ISQ5_9PSEU|nr:SGNH/GDSL hydrolase family protein [Amycolatopsis bartoniae]MBB2937936.1 acyl-CoA thioesterase-1 [Amycolatopsis bartoniae]GHF41828.1 hypothetical protein GCM10017566_14140 [Amycolatopsis bartoniae]